MTSEVVGGIFNCWLAAIQGSTQLLALMVSCGYTFTICEQGRAYWVGNIHVPKTNKTAKAIEKVSFRNFDPRKDKNDRGYADFI